MRRGRNQAWMEDEHQQMIACNLGSDYTAEHEWGIKELYEILGIKNDESVLGIDRYRVTNPRMDHIKIIEENKNNAALICCRWSDDFKYLEGKTLDKMFNGELTMYGESELATAWDGKTFGIRVKRPVNIKRIKRLYDSISKGDAAVWLGGGHVFRNAGLVIGIISAIPADLKQQMYDAHVDKKKLKEASDATGIVQKIDALNKAHVEKNNGNMRAVWDQPCGYYALSPGWGLTSIIRNNEHTPVAKTKYPVMYWLNPREQQKNESGWYTVEELEQWIEGKGPVVENSKEAKKKATAIVPKG